MIRSDRFSIFAATCTGLTAAFFGFALLVAGNSIVRAEPRQNAGASKTVWDGVYTTDQSKRGEGISNASCSACHGDKLVGTDIGPVLFGDSFLGNWSGSTAYDLFDKIRATMPANTP